MKLITSDFDYLNLNVGKDDNFIYYFTNDNKAIISKYIGNSNCVIIPNEIKNLPIIEIGNKAFKNSDVESVIVQEGIEKIGNNAFSECKHLKKIELPESLSLIEHSAFNHCVELESIDIPYKVRKIPAKCFYSCISLKNVDIRGIDVIDDEAFAHCNRLTDLTFGNYLQHINRSAFLQCHSIKNIVIPNSVKSIESDVFASCKHLKTVDIQSPNITLYGDTFSNCTDLENVRLNNVKTIFHHAFFNCSSLKEITLPPSVERIYGKPFEQCNSLKKINILNELVSISQETLQQIVKNNIDYSGSCVKVIKKINEEKPYVDYEYALLPTGISVLRYIGDDKVIRVPEEIKGKAVTKIQPRAFSRIDAEHIIIPNTVVSLPSYVFEKCSHLKSITIPEQINKIERNLLRSCPNDVIIKCNSNSYAKQWANENGYKCKNISSKLTDFLEKTERYNKLEIEN